MGSAIRVRRLTWTGVLSDQMALSAIHGLLLHSAGDLCSSSGGVSRRFSGVDSASGDRPVSSGPPPPQPLDDDDSDVEVDDGAEETPESLRDIPAHHSITLFFQRRTNHWMVRLG